MKANVKPLEKGRLRLDRMNSLGILATLALLVVFFALKTPVFLQPQNLINILVAVSMLCICAVGMTMIILTGGIDLSIGAILGTSGIVVAALMSIYKWHPVPAIIVSLLTGALIGAINGLLITKLKMPPFIATLAMMSILRGTLFTFTGGQAIYNMPKSFNDLAGNVFGVIPIPLIIMVCVLVAGLYILQFTKLGRYIYAIGGNENATHLSGINVTRYKVQVYAIAGFLAAIAALIMTTRMNAAIPIAGERYELNSIAAVVIGGTSMAGGEGNLIGTFIGVLIMGVINNGMVLLNVQQGAQQIVLGVIMLIAVLLDIIRQGKLKA